MKGVVLHNVSGELVLNGVMQHIDCFAHFVGERTIRVLPQSQVDYLLLGQASDLSFRFEIGEGSLCRVFCLGGSRDEFPFRLTFQGDIHEAQVSSVFSFFGFAGNASVFSLDACLSVGKEAFGAHLDLRQSVLLLGDHAEISLVPRLDVACDQVHATHAAKIDKLDPSFAFYLASRGLSPLQSQKLWIEGAVSSVFSVFGSFDEERLAALQTDFLSSVGV